jgi:hypothetical protein
MMIKGEIAVGVVLAATVVFGCGPQQATIGSQMTGTPKVAGTPRTAAEPPGRPLPFKGRLAEGDPAEIPPAVAISLSNTAPVTFSYREELTHDEYHIPLIFSALDPVTYVGAPLGDFGVTAFASLSISEGGRIIGDYTAKAHVSKSYSLYSEPTHREVEQAARAAVRDRIDQKLYSDVDRLAQSVASTDKSSAAPAGK